MKLKVPYKKSRSGRFQISLFKDHRFVSPMSDCSAELSIAQIRVCIQYSHFDHWKQKWKRFSIWCSPDELSDLGRAISGLKDFNE